MLKFSIHWRAQLTHIHFVRVELYTVTPQPVVVSSLRIKIESTKIIEMIDLNDIYLKFQPQANSHREIR